MPGRGQQQRGQKRNISEVGNILSREPPGVYRFTRIGLALRQSLAELSSMGKITPFLEDHIFKEFDLVMTDRMSRIAEIRNVPTVHFEADGILKHSLVDGGWEIHFQGVTIHSDEIYVQLKSLQLLADTFSDRSMEKSKNIKFQLKH